MSDLGFRCSIALTDPYPCTTVLHRSIAQIRAAVRSQCSGMHITQYPFFNLRLYVQDFSRSHDRRKLCESLGLQVAIWRIYSLAGLAVTQSPSQSNERICCPINSSPGLSDLNSRTYPGSIQTYRSCRYQRRPLHVTSQGCNGRGAPPLGTLVLAVVQCTTDHRPSAL